MSDDLYGAPRGWVGPAEVMDPFKASITLSADGVALVNPPVGQLPCWADAGETLVSFALQARPGFVIDVPEGVTEMRPTFAAALLSVMASGRPA